MDELYFDNKKYITTKKAASIANYAKDYVGQLARSGKIDARLIGRNWYISEEALIQHAFGRKSELDDQNTGEDNILTSRDPQMQTQEEKIVLPDSETEAPADGYEQSISSTEISHLDEPIQNYGSNAIYNTDQSLHNEIYESTSGVENVERESSVRYWSDDSDLYPRMSEQTEVERMDHSLVDETEHEEIQTNTNAEPLPISDISKITLTMRNRLQSHNITREPYSIARSQPVTKSRSMLASQRPLVEQDYEEEAIPKIATRSRIMIWVIVATFLILIIGTTYYALSSERYVYVRQNNQ